MTASVIKRLEVAIDLLTDRCEAIKDWALTFNPVSQDILFIDEKIDNLKTMHVEYFEKLSELLVLVSEESATEKTTRANAFQAAFDTLVVKLKRIKVNHNLQNGGGGNPPPPPPPEPRIQLPTIPLPQFKGSIGEWVFFRDKFTALITENATLSDTQRLYYLKSALVNEAASLQSSNDTFQSLWAALKERFEVKRVIADNQICELFGLRQLTRESATDLRNLVDVITKNLRVLETLELPVNNLSELLIVNLVSTKIRRRNPAWI